MLRQTLPSTQQPEKRKTERTYFIDKALSERENRLRRLSEGIKQLEAGFGTTTTTTTTTTSSSSNSKRGVKPAFEQGSFSFNGLRTVPEAAPRTSKRLSATFTTGSDIGNGLDNLDRSLASCESRIERLHYRIRGSGSTKALKAQRLVQTVGTVQPERSAPEGAGSAPVQARSKSDDIGRFNSMVESSWNLKRTSKMKQDSAVQGSGEADPMLAASSRSEEEDSGRRALMAEKNSMKLKDTIRKAQEGNVSMQSAMDSMGRGRDRDPGKSVVRESTSDEATQYAIAGKQPANGSVDYKELQDSIAAKDAEIKRLKSTLEKVNEICALESRNMGLRQLIKQMPSVVKKNQELKKETETVEKLVRENAELQKVVDQRDRARQENTRLKKLVETMDDLAKENNALDKETKWLSHIEARNAFLHERARIARRLQKENERMENSIKELSPSSGLQDNATETVSKAEGSRMQEASEISLEDPKIGEMHAEALSKVATPSTSRLTRENGSRSTRSSSTRSSTGVVDGIRKKPSLSDSRGTGMLRPDAQSATVLKSRKLDDQPSRRTFSDGCFPINSLFSKSPRSARSPKG